MNPIRLVARHDHGPTLLRGMPLVTPVAPGDAEQIGTMPAAEVQIENSVQRVEGWINEQAAILGRRDPSIPACHKQFSQVG